MRKFYVDEHRAALDVHRAGAVDAVAGDAEVKVVGLLLDLRVDRVQVGDEADGRRAARDAILPSRGPAQQQMLAIAKAGRRHGLGLEAQLGEALGRQRPQAVDPAGVEGEAVDEHHLVQQVKIGGPVVGQVGRQFGVGGGVHEGSYSTDMAQAQA